MFTILFHADDIMQRNSVNPGKLSDWRICTTLLAGILVAIASAMVGCNGNAGSTAAPRARQTFTGVQLRIGCEELSIAREIARRAVTWSGRTGATVTVSTATECDVIIVRPGELGSRAVQRDAVPVPDEMRNSAHALQWSRLLSIWSDRLASWGGTPYGVPLAGESYVLAYRTDKFADGSSKYRRTISPPATWEDFAELAELFARDGGPSLAALPREPDGALREFHFVAACYDRLSLTGTDFNALMQNATKKEELTVSVLSFHHDANTGEPRLKTPAFVAAAKWYQRTAACRPKMANRDESDPVKDLLSGKAVMAIVSLAELGRIAKADGAADMRLGIAPLPGTKFWLDPATGQSKPPADKVRGVNFVPFFAAGGWIGTVRSGCQNPEAAFELLAEVGGLERSTEMLSDPSLGFGPFRVEHLDQPRETVWQRYGFDAERTQQLIAAVRHQTGSSLANPTVGLRGTDRAELLGLLASELAKVADGTATPEQAMAAADAAWRAGDAKRPTDALKLERRQAAGLR